jgi:hypothetical protein
MAVSLARRGSIGGSEAFGECLGTSVNLMDMVFSVVVLVNNTILLLHPNQS